MTEAPEDLDARVRRVDHDRWLASRFIADEAARADVIALYAFNDELARIPGAARQPILGEIRLAWWRESLDEIWEGKTPRVHPVLQALAEAIARRPPPREVLEAMIDARSRDLDPTPLADEAELLAYVDRTAGALMLAAARMLDASADPHAVRAAARAWGLVGLLRNRKLSKAELLGPGLADAILEQQTASLLAEARREAGRLPLAAFPAVAYATLAGPYARGRAPGDLEKRLRLTAAVATGRL
jgi:phytoene synthase